MNVSEWTVLLPAGDGGELTLEKPLPGSPCARRDLWHGSTCNEKAPSQTKWSRLCYNESTWNFTLKMAQNRIKTKSENTCKTTKKDALVDQDTLFVLLGKKKRILFLTPRQLSNRSDLPIFHFKNWQIPPKYHVFWLKFHSAKKNLAVL